jgi:hypothetical protein
VTVVPELVPAYSWLFFPIFRKPAFEESYLGDIGEGGLEPFPGKFVGGDVLGLLVEVAERSFEFAVQVRDVVTLV